MEQTWEKAKELMALAEGQETIRSKRLLELAAQLDRSRGAEVAHPAAPPLMGSAPAGHTRMDLEMQDGALSQPLSLGYPESLSSGPFLPMGNAATQQVVSSESAIMDGDDASWGPILLNQWGFDDLQPVEIDDIESLWSLF